MWCGCSEEPRNMGAWRFVQEQMQPILEPTPARKLRYAGRAPSASPASGSLKRHQEELAELLDQAFSAEVKLVESKRKVAARRRRRKRQPPLAERRSRLLMPVLAYTGCGAAIPGTPAGVGLACGFA